MARATRRLVGHYAIAALSTHSEDEIVAARNGPPLVLGLTRDEKFLASDAAALVSRTRDVVYLENGVVASLKPSCFNSSGVSAKTLFVSSSARSQSAAR